MDRSNLIEWTRFNLEQACNLIQSHLETAGYKGNIIGGETLLDGLRLELDKDIPILLWPLAYREVQKAAPGAALTMSRRHILLKRRAR